MEKFKKEINLYDGNKMILEVNNQITFIYGSNGMGKSTIARELEDSEVNNSKFFVFNERYISNKLYFYDKGEIKETVNITSNRFLNFITKDIKNNNDLINKLKKQKSSAKELLEVSFKKWAFNHNKKQLIGKADFSKVMGILTQEIEKEVSDFKIMLDSNPDYTSKNNRDESDEKYFEWIVSGISKTHEYNHFKQIINQFNFENFEKSEKKILDINNINDFNSTIVLELNKIFDLEKLYEKIDTYNNCLKNKKTYDKASRQIFDLICEYEGKKIKSFNHKQISEIISWRNYGKSIHEKNNLIKTCLFCSQKRLTGDLFDNYLSSIINDDLDKVILEIKNLISSLYSKLDVTIPICFTELKYENAILLNKDFEKQLNENIENTSKVLEIINNAINETVTANYVKKKMHIIEETPVETEPVDELIFQLWVHEEFDNELEEIINKNHLSDLSISKSIVSLRKIENEMLKDIEKKLNDKFEEIDNLILEPLNLVAKTTQGDLKANDYISQIKLLRKNGNNIVKQTSNGERNMIAFIFYLIDLRAFQHKLAEENKNVISVLDDIADSSDFYSYFTIKKLILEFIYADKIDIQTIILTHNYSFANIILQNSEKFNNTDVYKFVDKFMLEKTSQELFNLPDTLLLIKILEFISISSDKLQNSLALISFGAIYYKILESKYIEKYHEITKKYFILNDNWMDDIEKKFKNNTSEKVSNPNNYNNLLKEFSEFKKNRTIFFKNIKMSTVDIKEIKKSIICMKNALNNNGMTKLNLPNLEIIDNVPLIDNGVDFMNADISSISDIFIKSAIDSARIMVYSKVANRSDLNHVQRLVSNYLRHSTNAISAPTVALSYKKINKK